MKLTRLSIATVLQAAERDASVRGRRRARCGSGVPPFHVPRSVCLCRGHRVRVGPLRRPGRIPGTPLVRRALVDRSPPLSPAQYPFRRPTAPIASVLGGFALALHGALPSGSRGSCTALSGDCSPPRKPTPGAPLDPRGIITVLFGMADLFAWIGSQSLGLRSFVFFLTIVVLAGPGSWPPGCSRATVRLMGALARGAHRRRGRRRPADPDDHLRRARRDAEIGSLRGHRDRAGASALDLLRGPIAHRCHRGERVTVEAPDQRGSWYEAICCRPR